MAGIETSKELFINMKEKDIPKWNPKKSYYDQPLDVLQFWDAELHKMVHGLNVNGFHIHPWLYFHMNHFKTPIPKRTNEGLDVEIIMTPELDDNIFYTTESYQDAKEKNKALLLFGSRGVTKSTIITSNTQWTTLTRPNGVFSITGGSGDDLTAISNLMKKAFLEINPALYLPAMISDWDKHIEFGYKDKDQRKNIHSVISIVNAVKGRGESSTEKGAGLSPVGYVVDEIGKFDFLEIYKSAIPAFKTPFGWKLVPILAGTSGNALLSKDAREMLQNPEAFDVLPMNWDRLDRKVNNEDFRTWKDDKHEKFGTFFPGQMSYRLESQKLKSNLADYVGKPDDKKLSKISINVTNWEEATKLLEEKDKSLKKEADKNKHNMYYPRKIAHCFMTDSPNPFPVNIAERHLKELEDSGRIGKAITIEKENGKFVQKFSVKQRAKASHPGGNVDAPILLFGEFPETPPEMYTNVSGLDDFKLADSDTDSLGAFYVLTRANLSPNTPCETILMSLATKPTKHKDFHKQIENMIECSSAICLMEAIDTSFEQYLDVKGKADKWLAPAITFSNKTKKGNNHLQKKFGLHPTKGNNDFRFGYFVDWCWEEHVLGIDDEGNKIIKHGVEFIDDPDLLREIIHWKKGGNFDRIAAFSHALVQAREYDIQGVRPKSQRRFGNVLGRDTYDENGELIDNRDKKKVKKVVITPFGSGIGRKPFSF
jgi:hypothetical protein